MNTEIVTLQEDVSDSPLYSEDLAPVKIEERTWKIWDLTAIWIGMAVCIPTYMLASLMITVGLMWYEALLIIGAANLIVTLPMILNGHGGVKYGVPFPVLGRASFGIYGVHVPAVIRGLVACGWFGIQTWIGGLAIYAIWCTRTGIQMTPGLTLGKFVGFGLFWLINIYFVWKGTESIRWLERLSAPILIVMGLFLIGWGAQKSGGFGIVLEQSRQLSSPTASLTVSENGTALLGLHPLKNADGSTKAKEYQVFVPGPDGAYRELGWRPLGPFTNVDISTLTSLASLDFTKMHPIQVQFRAPDPANPGKYMVSTKVDAKNAADGRGKWLLYLFWLTAMVGYWATMSISIADITRYTRSQKAQAVGQLLGLPGTMILYSFVGIFVTCASLILFPDILVGENAPWEPVSLLARFNHPIVVIISQVFMLIATLSTNIAANVIAPANAFANAFPKKISFRAGGLITGVIGIATSPWWLMDQIGNFLIFVSAVLGPVLGIMVADYFFVRKTELHLADLFKVRGRYSFWAGFNPAAMIALLIGVAGAYIGKLVPSLSILHQLSWFTGSMLSFAVYTLMMAGKGKAVA